jgi:hypothetical protein
MAMSTSPAAGAAPLPLDDRRVDVGHVALQHLGATGHLDARETGMVLQADRLAGQRPAVGPFDLDARDPGVVRVPFVGGSVRARAIGVVGFVGSENRFGDLLDAFEHVERACNEFGVPLYLLLVERHMGVVAISRSSLRDGRLIGIGIESLPREAVLFLPVGGIVPVLVSFGRSRSLRSDSGCDPGGQFGWAIDRTGAFDCVPAIAGTVFHPRD